MCWPQAWLGLVFTWGAPVGWVEATGFERLAPLGLLYAGCWAWCMAYDTIYALQDREDDALVGIRSSALRLGDQVQAGVLAFYCLALTLWGLAFWLLLKLAQPKLTNWAASPSLLNLAMKANCCS